MPPTKKKTTRSAAGKKQHLRHEELVQEMHQLHEAIDDLHLEIHKLTPPTAIRKAVRSFATGLVKGVGFVVGTTLIAALLIYFVQQSLESGKLQDWVGDQGRGAITESIDEYTPSFLQRD